MVIGKRSTLVKVFDILLLDRVLIGLFGPLKVILFPQKSFWIPKVILVSKKTCWTSKSHFGPPEVNLVPQMSLYSPKCHYTPPKVILDLQTDMLDPQKSYWSPKRYFGPPKQLEYSREGRYVARCFRGPLLVHRMMGG